MDLASRPTSCLMCLSVFTGHSMVANNIPAGRAWGWLSAKPLSKLMVVSSGPRAACMVRLSPSPCHLSRLLLPRYLLTQRSGNRRPKNGGVYDGEEAHFACRRRSDPTRLCEPEPARTWLRDTRGEQWIGSDGSVGAGNSSSTDSRHYDASHGWSRGVSTRT